MWQDIGKHRDADGQIVHVYEFLMEGGVDKEVKRVYRTPLGLRYRNQTRQKLEYKMLVRPNYFRSPHSRMFPINSEQNYRVHTTVLGKVNTRFCFHYQKGCYKGIMI